MKVGIIGTGFGGRVVAAAFESNGCHVTDVVTAQDLREAVVYVSSMSEEAADALGERRAALQRAVASQSRMKRTPRLSFQVDPAVTQGAAIDEALRRLEGRSDGS